MAAPRLTLAALVLLLAVFTLTEGLRGIGPKKCCQRFNKKQVQKERVLSYTKTSQQCLRSAVIFKLVDGKELCARPSTGWVKEMIRHLDATSARAGETSNL